MAKVSRKNIYEIINERIFEMLEKGEIPWQKPWISGEPANFVSKRPYRGINPFMPLLAVLQSGEGYRWKNKKGRNGFPGGFLETG